jgi:hypothetical protein
MFIWLKPILIGLIIGIIGIVLWIHIFGTLKIRKEEEANKKKNPPDEDQLKWDIRHIRQDIMSMTVLKPVKKLAALSSFTGLKTDF